MLIDKTKQLTLLFFDLLGVCFHSFVFEQQSGIYLSSIFKPLVSRICTIACAMKTPGGRPKMSNFYYYSFYLLSMFSKKVNKRNSDYTFSGMAYLSLLLTSNIFTVLAILELTGSIKIKGSFLYIGVALCVMVINYFFLIVDNKSASIIKVYQERRQNKVYAAAFYVYVLLSLITCGYTTYLVRNIQG